MLHRSLVRLALLLHVGVCHCVCTFEQKWDMIWDMNYVPILHRFWDIARCWSKIAFSTYSTCIWRHRWEWRHGNFAKIFGIRKLDSVDYCKALFAWSIGWPCRTATCDIRADGQTDRQTHDDNIYCTSMASRDKKYWKNTAEWLSKPFQANRVCSKIRMNWPILFSQSAITTQWRHTIRHVRSASFNQHLK